MNNIYYAAAFFNKDIWAIEKRAQEEKIHYCISQKGCPLGMKGLYFEFRTREQKARFLVDINLKINPAVVWAS